MKYTVQSLLLGLVCLLVQPQAMSATSEEQARMSVLPRLALVFGNSRYAQSPLSNPGNDAKAIAEELKRSGFNVRMKLDATRQEMQDAIKAFGKELAQQKGVGVFYFAGHGAQLAWHNYLIPVDAQIKQLSDMQAQAVDLTVLLESLRNAGNPMNVIILDACRDNPFGATRLEQKGLSQMDAPSGTLLAYATAPGNVAADGLGKNGLYTEFLLKEIFKREAKIEDIFKRVRLNVRIKSNGQQIPWESTSLEQDFYFFPPKQFQQLTEEEIDRQFQEEFALWEKIKSAKEVAPLEEYLQQYPNGKFSELAQFKLDRIFAKQQAALQVQMAKPAPTPQPPMQIAMAETRVVNTKLEANPFSKGMVRVSADYRIGDQYTYRASDSLTGVERDTFTRKVTDVTDAEVIFNNGDWVSDLLGNISKNRRGQTFTGSQVYVSEYTVGKKWSTRYSGTRPNGQAEEFSMEFKVVGKEKITVPAGTFDAFKVEGQGYLRLLGATRKVTYWIAPEQVRQPLTVIVEVYRIGGKYFRTDREDLVSYQQQ